MWQGLCWLLHVRGVFGVRMCECSTGRVTSQQVFGQLQGRGHVLYMHRGVQQPLSDLLKACPFGLHAFMLCIAGWLLGCLASYGF
jgi:hypothetical protein